MSELPPHQPPAATPGAARRRLLRAAGPRATRGQLAAALLCLLLGFAAVAQVRATREAGLSGLRQADLVRILDDVSERSERLDAEAGELEQTRQRLAAAATAAEGSDRTEALTQARDRQEALGILAGTLPAYGPGIELVIPDPRAQVEPEVLLNAVQELRDAGAEAMQLGPVRVAASTAVTGGGGDGRGGGIAVDGTGLSPPYRLLAVGDARTLASALDIPGGVLEVLRQRGSPAVVHQREQVEVTALRAPKAPQYARPASQPE